MPNTDTFQDRFYNTFGTPSPTQLARQRTLESYYAALLSPVTKVYRRMDIYESDGTTPFLLNVPIEDGNVSVDQSRQERRTLECTLFNDDGDLDNYPGGFWYDKILKPYRGIVARDGTTYSTQLGEFLIDQINTERQRPTVKVSCRDYTKKCLISKFPQATTFPSSSYIEDVIKTIALNAGVSKFNLPFTGQTIGTTFTFERGDERWKAINDIATSFNYEIFFDNQGFLTMRGQRDPVTSPTTFSFETGAGIGNLVHWTKQTTDARLYNHIVVTGEREGQVPVVAEATNTEPSSPTRIAKIGDRVYQYVSQFISTTLQAQNVANSYLKIHALEQFDLNFTALVVPWLEVGDIVEFFDTNPMPGDPYRFLLSSLNIPLRLGPMAAVGKRVTVVK